MLNLTKKRKIELIILLVLLALTLGFIWGSSALNREQSSAFSQPTTGFINSVLQFIFGTGQFTEWLVRKIAHITEFFILTLILCRIFSVLRVYNVKFAGGVIILAFIVALIDEGIQHFSGRFPSFYDVGIDLIGVAIAFVIYLVVNLIYIKVKKNKAQKNSTQVENSTDGECVNEQNSNN